jgi:hypothetical protein
MATLEKKSPSSVNKLSHQQSLPTHQVSRNDQLQQKTSESMAHNTNRLNSEEFMQISNEESLSSEVEPINDCECDRGFGSMSSSEQAQLSKNQLIRQNQIVVEQQQETQKKEVDDLRQEVTKLKCDKLDLLRQNVVCCLMLF